MASNGNKNKNNDNDDDDGAANVQNSTAAMNLFERYSSINRGIDEAREEMKQIRLATEEIHRRMETTRQERDTMDRDTSVAYTEANDFHRQVDDAYEALSKLQSDCSKVLMEKQRAQRQLDGVKAFVEEHRRQFLDQSREFRSSCKRMRLRANDLGLDYAPLKAFATVVSDPSIAAEWKVEDKDNEKEGVSPKSVLPRDFQEDKRNFQQPASMPKDRASTTTTTTTGSNVMDENSMIDSDPTKWIPDPRDDEMKQALKRYDQELAKHDDAKQDLEALRTQNSLTKDRAMKRTERKEKIQAQLQRINTEKSSLEGEVAELAQLIQESQAMAQGYAKNIKSKRNEIAQRRFEEGLTSTSNPGARSQGNTATRPPHNPYAQKKQATTGSGANTNAASNNNKDKRNKANATSNTASSQQRKKANRQNQQHPHRVGRVRLGRQFTTNFHVVAGDEVLDEAEYTHNGRSSSAARSSSAVAAESSTTTNNRIEQSIALLEESDEDDDILLAKVF